ncbi:MAG: MmcB family DNA repair protein [Marinicaulis sp.]|nr:MmcB family DNA repair protein [Marinicaulis sp.]NNE42270.1 MmcB family DNA repair protein [Marinicaulis sp.]NNL87493.1 MmcB family DNA repair protein [Marinicaulis sp.]
MENIEQGGAEEQSGELCRPDQTIILTQGIIRLFTDFGFAPLAEFKLSNGRRVDVAALDRKGRLIFAEVKSCRADFECDQKWTEYLEFCDEFFFAVDPTFPKELLPSNEGFILADRYGAVIQRQAQQRTLAAARRKAVTLRFARQAARRAIIFAP